MHLSFLANEFIAVNWFSRNWFTRNVYISSYEKRALHSFFHKKRPRWEETGSRRSVCVPVFFSRILPAKEQNEIIIITRCILREKQLHIYNRALTYPTSVARGARYNVQIKVCIHRDDGDVQARHHRGDNTFFLDVTWCIIRE